MIQRIEIIIGFGICLIIVRLLDDVGLIAFGGRIDQRFVIEDARADRDNDTCQNDAGDDDRDDENSGLSSARRR